MTITSTAVQANGHILPDYTCDGRNNSPPLTFSEIPDDATSLALIVEDPDAPHGVFVHWLLYDMSPATLQIPENGQPMTGKVGVNDFGQLGYGGPCPPSGTHRYIFSLYALDDTLDLPEGATKDQLQTAMHGHMIASAQLIGSYTKAAPTT
jgi:Raf kinase inhibitor-like YbhB/YbcL family protein